jgi:hypothetical protein
MWIEGLGWQGFSLLIRLNKCIFCFALLVGQVYGSAENTPVCRKMGDECAGIKVAPAERDGDWCLADTGAVYERA